MQLTNNCDVPKISITGVRAMNPVSAAILHCRLMRTLQEMGTTTGIQEIHVQFGGGVRNRELLNEIIEAASSDPARD